MESILRNIIVLTVLSFVFIGCDTKDNVDPNQESGFVKFYGGLREDIGYDVIQVSDGGYVAAGSSRNFDNGNGVGDADMYLIKTDAQGDMEWQRSFGDTLNDEAGAVTATNDGGYIITGYTTDTSGCGCIENLALIKTDGMGNLQWQQTYGYTNSNERGSDVIQTADGGYAVVGITTQNNANGNSLGERDIFMIKTDANGDTTGTGWIRQHGGAGFDVGVQIFERGTGGFIVLSSSLSPGPGLAQRNLMLILTNNLGFEDNRVAYGGTGIDNAGGMIRTNTGVVIAGTFENPSTDKDIYIAKIDVVGNSLNLIWENTFGSASEDEEGVDVAFANNGGYVVLAKKRVNPINYKIQLSFADNTGSWLSSGDKTYGGTSEDIPTAIYQTGDLGYIVTGQIGFETDKMLGLIKTNDVGEINN